MNIYTRGGDQGETSLPDGSRTPKDSDRVGGYGALDELASLLGWLAAQDGIDPPLLARLTDLVTQTMEAGSTVASGRGEPNHRAAGKVADLERWIDEMQADMPPLANFILPMGSPAATACHVVRSSCRRIERILVQLNRQEPITGWVLPWINRLADYLFVLARHLNHRGGGGDVLWQRNQPQSQ